MPKADVFEFYKATPLPSRAVPFVVIAYQIFPSGGGLKERHRVQLFIALPGTEVFAQELDLNHHLVPSSLAGELPTESMERAALLRVQIYLEQLVRLQIGASAAGGQVTFPPVVLTHGDEHDLKAFVLAPEYAEAWEYIRTHTHGEMLRAKLAQCKALRQAGLAFGNISLNLE